MLKELQIENLILIQSAHLRFEEGLHVFSGETGAGKTAILTAMRLISGAKADTQFIRKGSDKMLVRAFFEIDNLPIVGSVLKNAGISLEDDLLIIQREVSTLGKSKVYINHQIAQVNLLKQIAPFLMEVVAQHASQQLLEPTYHREIIDTFGQHESTLQEVMETYCHLTSLKEELTRLKNQQQKEEQLKQQWRDDYEEIEKAAISSATEDEALFQEYEKLAHAQELIESLTRTYHILQEDDLSIIASLKQQLGHFERLNLSENSFQEMMDQMRSISDNLSELSFSILHYKDTLEENPERLHFIDERLKLFKSLTRRFGPTLQDVINYREKLLINLSQLNEISDHQKKLSQQIHQTQNQFNVALQKLSSRRKVAIEKFIKSVHQLLGELNLPNAELIIETTERTPDGLGCENIEFFLKANVGENKAALKDRASGGELSRLLLAFKVVLANLDQMPTLIFDEIDSGVGGKTAPKIGQLFKKMSKHKQLFVITHLPQVAAFSDHHYEIKKIEDNQRTFSLISKLNEKQKLLEIERMLGGKDLSQNTQKLAEDLIQSSKS